MDIQPKSASRYILTALAVILVITAFILVALNAFTIQSQPLRIVPKKTAEQGYIEGYQAARKKYHAICPIANLEAFSFTGTVQSVSGKSITVLQTSLDTDPAADGVSNTRTVTIASSTLIQETIVKTPEQLAKDAQDLQTSLKKGGTISPPSSFVPSSVSDIKAGQTVFIQSDTDVRLLSTISATIIRIVK